MGTRRLALALAGTVAGLLLASPAGAAASTVTRTGSLITVTADAGEANVVSVGAQYSTVDVSDAGAPLVAGAGCTQVSAGAATCGPHDSPRVIVSLGDGNDTMQRQSYALVGPLEVHGGPGDDEIVGSIVGDDLSGDDGDDTVDGYGGEDVVRGGAGDDSVAGGTENDLVDGGSGQDTLNGDGSNPLYDGSDRIVSRDGERDTVTCGFGTDTVSADALDVLDADGQCESVDRGTAPAPVPISGPAPAPEPMTLDLKAPSRGRLSRLLGRRGFTVRLVLSQPCRATIGLTVRAADARRLGLGRRRVRIARTARDVAQAGTVVARLTVAGRYRHRLRRARRVPARLSVSCSGAAGRTASRGRKVTFRR